MAEMVGRGIATVGSAKMRNLVEPSQVQVAPCEGDKWSWAVWYGPGNNAPDLRDRKGTADTLSLALSAVQSNLQDAMTRALAYD